MNHDARAAAGIAGSLTLAALIAQGGTGFNLQDEGYLWYGVVQTALGQVPVRDFHSYDPGRYLWSAPWTALLGPGLWPLRFSLAAFQWLSLTFGLLAARKAGLAWTWAALLGASLLLWMQPFYRVFDPGLAMIAVYVGTLLVEDPSRRRHIAAGAFAGLAAFFGRNHGLYILLAFVVLAFWQRRRGGSTSLTIRLGCLLLGTVAGYAPMLAMLAAVPGFAAAFYALLAFNVEQGTTNLALPIPGYFWALPVFYAAAGLALLRSRSAARYPVLAAAVTVGVFYLHHAFSRADLEHLANSIPPLLLGVAAAAAAGAAGRRWLVPGTLSALLAVALLAPGRASPLAQRLATDDFQQAEIQGSRFWVHRDTAFALAALGRLQARIRPGESLVVLPHWPGVYPVLGRRSPLYHTLVVFPDLPERQRDMIRDLEAANVVWAVTGDVPLDGRDDLRMSRTLPLLWDYLTREFEPVKELDFPPNYEVRRLIGSGRRR